MPSFFEKKKKSSLKILKHFEVSPNIPKEILKYL